MSEAVWTSREYEDEGKRQFSNGFLISFVVTLFIGFLICLGAVHHFIDSTQLECRQKAVKHGGAKWVADKDGVPQFHWNDEVIEVEKK